MARYRWIWMQYHGTHQETSCEYQLRHVLKKPFLCGSHQLDDPALLEVLAAEGAGHEFYSPPEEREEAAARAQEMTYTSVGWPPAAPQGGYAHLSWMYYNFAPTQQADPSLIEIADKALACDPAVRLLVFAQYAHPAVQDLVEWLRANHRQRFILAYRKFSNIVYYEEHGLHVPVEDWLLEHADVRIIHFGCASAYPMFNQFIAKHDVISGKYTDIGSRMSAREIDYVVELAERAMAKVLASQESAP